MAPAKSIKDLKNLSDNDLIAIHDELAKNTVVGTSYYLEELRNRSAQRSQDEMEKLTNRIYGLTVVITMATFVQLSIVATQFFW